MRTAALLFLAAACALSAVGNLIWTVQGGKRKTAKECAYDVVGFGFTAATLLILAVSGA